MELLFNICCPSIPTVPVELRLVRTQPAKSLSTAIRTVSCLGCHTNSLRARGAHLQNRPNLFRRCMVMFVGPDASRKISLIAHFSSMRCLAA